MKTDPSGWDVLSAQEEQALVLIREVKSGLDPQGPDPTGERLVAELVRRGFFCEEDSVLRYNGAAFSVERMPGQRLQIRFFQ